MDIFDVAEKRYSHKGMFLPDPVPLEDLERIAKVGIAAPSGGNTQCVKLVILPNRAAIQPLHDISPANGLLTAPAAIVLLTEKQTGELNFEIEDYAAATANMLLAAVQLGYVSLWLDSPFYGEAEQKQALEVLGATQDYHVYVVLPIGLPDGPGSRRKKLPFSERVFYGRLGQEKP